MNDDDDKESKWQKSTSITIVNAKVAHVSCMQDFIIIRHISRIATHNDGGGGGDGEGGNFYHDFFPLLFSFTQFTSFYTHIVCG